MKKLMFISLLSLVTINYLWAEEYISEVTTQSEVMHESIESLPITKTIEEEVREKEEQIIVQDEIVVSFPVVEAIIPVIEETKVVEKEPDTPNFFERFFNMGSNSDNQSIQKFSYEDALEQAKTEKKIIMLSIRSNNCKYCDKMEAETLSDEHVKDALIANFITIYYNQDLDTLPLNLQNGATPMFIFVNTNEDILNMYPGIRNPEEFKTMLKEILAK